MTEDRLEQDHSPASAGLFAAAQGVLDFDVWQDGQVASCHGRKNNDSDPSRRQP